MGRALTNERKQSVNLTPNDGEVSDVRESSRGGGSHPVALGGRVNHHLQSVNVGLLCGG